MPDKDVVEQAKRDLREGKSPSTAAGEFVRREVEHVREGKQRAYEVGQEKRKAGARTAPRQSAARTVKAKSRSRRRS